MRQRKEMQVLHCIPCDTADEPSLSAPPNCFDASYVQRLLLHVDPKMRVAKRWVLWKLVFKSQATKPLKIPYYINGGPRGRTDDEADLARLGTFEDAVTRYQAGGFQGLGFALGPDETGGYWQGIDLDDVDANGLKSLAEALPSFVETSPSGLGVHAIGYGKPFPALGSNGTGIESYCQGRYLTVSGQTVRGSPLVCLANVVTELLEPRHRAKLSWPTEAADVVPLGLPVGLLADVRSALTAIPADCGYNDWIRIGCALKAIGARELFIEWSYSSPSSVPGEPEAKWDQLAADRTGHAAIFAEAQRRGWHNPSSHYASQVALNSSAIALADKVRAGFAASTALQSNVIGLDQFTGEFAPPLYVWHHVLQVGCLYALTALWGGGKTAVALTIALHVATGQTLARHRISAGKVLFLCGENPEDVKLRVKAACAVFGIGPAELSGRVFFTRRPFHIDQPSALTQFAAEAEQYGPYSLCIVDTGPAHSSADDENDNRQMHALAIALRGLMTSLGSPATIVLMHPAKGAKRDTLQPRGGGSFSGSIDGELCAWQVCGNVEFFHRVKFRGPGFKPIRFELQRHTFPDILDNFGEPAVSVVAVPVDKEPEAKFRLGKADKTALAALASCRDVAIAPPPAVLDTLPQCWGETLFPPLQVVPEAVWRDACYQHGISEGEQSAKAAAFRRSQAKLASLNQIQGAAAHFWLSQWCVPHPETKDI